MKSMLAGFVVALAVVGCSVPPVTAAPIAEGDTPATTKDPSASKASTTGAVTPVDTTSDPKTVDTKAPTTDPVTSAVKGTTFTGTLDSTNVVPFGGSGFCNYQVVLTNMQVSMTFDSENRPTASKVSATMTETIVEDGTCTATPLGSLPYAFSYSAPASGPTTATSISEVGDPGNNPTATLDVSAGSGSATSLHVNLVFHRTGGVADQLNWTITTALDLTPAES